MNLVQMFLNAFRVPELRRRLLFTFGMLAIYRLGSQIPLPGIHISQLVDLMNKDNLWGMVNLLSGGNIARMTIFALGITPYITSSIFLQLMTVLIPSLARLQKEGELGRNKLARWTRYLTVAIALAQSVAVARLIESLPGNLTGIHGPFLYFLTMLSLTTGAIFLMWLGEQITERGIGNGASLLIFAGILTNLPKAIENLYVNTFVTHEWPLPELIAVVAILALVVAFVVLVESSDRRIPIHYSRRAAGRQTQHLPVKLNAAGVMPVIFASAMLGIPQSLATLPGLGRISGLIRHGEPLYYLLFATAVMFFCFFYVSVIFNPSETADNLRKSGGFIAGHRPGKETSKYFDRALTRLTWIGAAYLVVLCLIPDIMFSGIRLQHLPLAGNWIDAHAPRFVLDGLNVSFYFGGTSLLIVVGVAMDLVNQIEAQLIMRHYENYSTARKRVRRGNTVRSSTRVLESVSYNSSTQ